MRDRGNDIWDFRKNSKRKIPKKMDEDSGIYIMNNQSDNSCSDEESRCLSLSIEEQSLIKNHRMNSLKEKSRIDSDAKIDINNQKIADIQSQSSRNDAKEGKVKQPLACYNNKESTKQRYMLFSSKSFTKLSKASDISNSSSSFSVRSQSNSSENVDKFSIRSNSPSPLSKTGAVLKDSSRLVKTKSQELAEAPKKKSFFSRLSSASNLLDRESKTKVEKNTSASSSSANSPITKSNKKREKKDKDFYVRSDLIGKSEAYKMRMEKMQYSKPKELNETDQRTSITSILFGTTKEYPKDIMEQPNDELWCKKSSKKIYDSTDKKFSRTNTEPTISISQRSAEYSSSKNKLKSRSDNSAVPIDFTKTILSSSELFGKVVNHASRASSYKSNAESHKSYINDFSDLNDACQFKLCPSRRQKEIFELRLPSQVRRRIKVEYVTPKIKIESKPPNVYNNHNSTNFPENLKQKLLLEASKNVDMLGVSDDEESVSCYHTPACSPMDLPPPSWGPGEDNSMRMGSLCKYIHSVFISFNV